MSINKDRPVPRPRYYNMVYHRTSMSAFPVIIKPTSSTMERVKITAKLEANATFTIEYYSNVDATGIECYKVLNLTQQSRIVCRVEQQTKMVDLPVFSHIVRTPGEEANISIEIDNEEKFGPYDVIVSNTFSRTKMSIDVTPEGPPFPLKDIIIDEIQETTVSLSWKPGFNGGFKQTFVIQRLSTTNWLNFSFVEEPLHETIIKDLTHSTTYFVRMYAFNVIGASEFTVTYNFTTLFKDTLGHETTSAALIGGAVGGSVSIILFLIVVFLALKRRGVLMKGDQISRSKSDRKNKFEAVCDPTYYNEGGRSMYEQLSMSSMSKDHTDYDVIIGNQHNPKNSLQQNINRTANQVEALQTSAAEDETVFYINTKKEQRQLEKTYENLKITSTKN